MRDTVAAAAVIMGRTTVRAGAVASSFVTIAPEVRRGTRPPFAIIAIVDRAVGTCA